MGRCAILLAIGAVALGFLGPVHPIRADVGLQSDTLRLSLEEAVARALRESEEIATARTAMAQADAQVVQATASALPQLSSSLTYNRAIRSIFDQAQGPPPVSDSLQDFMSALFGGLPFGRKNTYIATLTLTQPVYVGGKVGAALKVAEHYRAAARDQLAETEEDITLQVRSAYLTAGLAQRLVDIAVESRRLAGEHLSQVESFFEAGTAAEFDLLRARVDLENRDPIVVQAQNSATLALLDLKRLVNVPAEQQLRLTSEMDPTVVEVDKPALRRMVMERPALQAAAEAVGMQEQAVKIARGNRLPTVTFLGTMGFQSFPDNPLPPGFDQWRKDWSAALSISLPIFDGFRTRGEIDMAQADLKTAELQADQLREALSLQLAGALAEYEAARSQIRARRETVGMAERALELAEVRFASGMSTQLEVSDAALLLDQARVNEVQSLYDYVRALATLERLSGGKMELIGVGS
jgi:outer membrane protein TolC